MHLLKVFKTFHYSYVQSNQTQISSLRMFSEVKRESESASLKQEDLKTDQSNQVPDNKDLKDMKPAPGSDSQGALDAKGTEFCSFQVDTTRFIGNFASVMLLFYEKQQLISLMI